MGLKNSIIYRRQVHLILNFTISFPEKSMHRVRIHFIISETEFFDHADDWKSHFSAYQAFIDIKGIMKTDHVDRRASSNAIAWKIHHGRYLRPDFSLYFNRLRPSKSFPQIHKGLEGRISDRILLILRNLRNLLPLLDGTLQPVLSNNMCRRVSEYR